MSALASWHPSRVMFLGSILFFAASVAAQDLIYDDGYEPGPDCSAVPGAHIALTTTPPAVSTTLGTTSRYIVRVRSCDYAGSVNLTKSGALATWNSVLDSSALTLALHALGMTELVVSVPSDADAGNATLTVTAEAPSGNFMPTTAQLTVANQYIATIPMDTGNGDHHFPVDLALKLGAELRIVNGDITSHRINSDNGNCFATQANDMMQGQEYDVTPAVTGNCTFHCHDHFGNGTTGNVIVH